MAEKNSYELVGFRAQVYQRGAYLHQEEIDRDAWYFELDNPPKYATDIKYLVDVVDPAQDDLAKRLRWGSYDRILKAKENLVRLSVDFMGNSFGGWLTSGIEYECDTSGKTEVFSEHMAVISAWIREVGEHIRFDDMHQKRFSFVSLWEYDSGCSHSYYSEDDDCWSSWRPIGLVTTRHLHHLFVMLEGERIAKIDGS